MTKNITYILVLALGLSLSGYALANSSADDAEGFYELAEIYLEQGKLERAITLYRRVLALDPTYAAAYYDLGKAYLTKGKTDTAIECLNYAISCGYSNANAYYILGNAHSAKRDFSKSMECYEEALSLDPEKDLKKQIKNKLKSVKKKMD